jgi:hypothetical protein
MLKESPMWKHTSICSTFALAAILTALIASPVSARDTKPIKLFFLCGQSNMVGGDKASKLEPPYSNPLPKIKIWKSKGRQWVPLDPKAVSYKGRFGPEISFGHAMAQAFPGEDIRLVKYAAGGTALHDDWSPTVKGRQYTGFMKTAKSALEELTASGTEYEVAGMMWLQGESDAGEKKGDAYEKNLTEFIAHMRAEFKTPHMPFIIARVRSHYGKKTGHATLVRDAQVKVGDTVKCAGWFDTDHCSMVNNGHYDAAGLIEIGKRFAENYTGTISKAKKP